MTPISITIATAIGTGLLLVIGLGVTVAMTWRAVPSGKALIINRAGGPPRISFSGAVVLPVVQRAELIDLSVKKLVIVRRGREGLSCRDGIRADLEATFLLRVNPTEEDILRVASSLGAERAGDEATLTSLFTAKFAEALKSIARRLDFVELYNGRAEFRDRVLQEIGPDLNGFRLDDLAIDALSQTPIDQLDPNDILDAEGIRKIRARLGA